jgi:hypothetical protein
VLSTVAFPPKGDKLAATQRPRFTGVAIVDYRIICVVRGTDGDLQGVGYAANGNAVMYDEIWSVEQARSAVEQGHRLYILGPVAGFGEVEVFEDGIRATSAHGAGDRLDALPPCG